MSPGLPVVCNLIPRLFGLGMRLEEGWHENIIVSFADVPNAGEGLKR